MKLENTFRIPVPADEAWPVLLDLERLAPCVPGATLTSRDGDDFHGKIKVKLGPVGLTYNGVIKILSQDADAGIAVLEGGGRETRGNGTAKAVITCRLVESGGVTDVFVDTDLAITGKPAQFGRGALADVAGTLIGTFADNLAAEITSSAGGAADEGVEVASNSTPADATGQVGAAPTQIVGAEATGPTRAPRTGPADAGSASSPRPAGPTPVAARPGAEPIDLMAAAGLSANRQLLLALGAATLVILFLLSRNRRECRG
ncbi:SRPBCC family protein [Nocardia flavorosea]|uniref:Carbon monoxide dehydrogenase n=1 Tax=Nocardia flavorosea TaxID=53429 RepID=A0A846YJ39_9NOCA|nr:SRPBCC family protein [Nocardia flavorosea]NKY58903.1 carbon monoxide dehydrogenase [Nocardia flavorosea]